MFFDESKWITKATFLQNYIEIDSVVSDKKIFKVFYIDTENKPRPLAAMFFDESNWLEQS